MKIVPITTLPTVPSPMAAAMTASKSIASPAQSNGLPGAATRFPSSISAVSLWHLTIETQDVVAKNAPPPITPAQAGREAIANNSDLGTLPFGKVISLVARDESTASLASRTDFDATAVSDEPAIDAPVEEANTPDATLPETDVVEEVAGPSMCLPDTESVDEASGMSNDVSEMDVVQDATANVEANGFTDGAPDLTLPSSSNSPAFQARTAFGFPPDAIAGLLFGRAVSHIAQLKHD